MIRYAFDIGPRSIGAVIFRHDHHGHHLLWSGVTIYGIARRERDILKRLIRARKRRENKKRRLLEVRKWLEDHQLLPGYKSRKERDAIFGLNPQQLYEEGLKRTLNAYELGRVLYHAMTRRGASPEQYGGCRQYEAQRQRLETLWRAQLSFKEANAAKSVSNNLQTLINTLFAQNTRNRCAFYPNEQRLYAAQPLAEIAQYTSIISKISFQDPLNAATEIRSHILGQLMLGKAIDRQSLTKDFDISPSDILWPPHVEAPLQMENAKVLSKPGHFGHIWHRLSLNQQDHLVTAIIEKNQENLIQFWPKDLPFTPERLDRLLELPLPRSRISFGPSHAERIIKETWQNKSTSHSPKGQSKRKLFKHVFKRLLHKMQHGFGKPDEILIEFPERQGSTKSINLRFKLFDAHFNERRGGYPCPYTGKIITKDMLENSAIELDHIIPKSRGGKSNLGNLTLSMASANRQKSNKTPFEAFGQTGHWQHICENILHWPEEKQRIFKSQGQCRSATDSLKTLQLEQKQLDQTTHLSRSAKNLSAQKFPDAKISFVSSVKAHQLRQSFNLEKNRNDLRQHSLDAGLAYIAHTQVEALIPKIASDIEEKTRPIFVATQINSQARQGALARYHCFIDIVKDPDKGRWNLWSSLNPEPQSEDHVMRLRKGDLLYFPLAEDGEKYRRVFRIQPSNGTIGLGLPYLAGKEGSTPLIYKSSSQLERQHVQKCRQKPLGYTQPQKSITPN